jgi:hypothetical protein
MKDSRWMEEIRRLGEAAYQRASADAVLSFGDMTVENSPEFVAYFLDRADYHFRQMARDIIKECKL